MEIESIIAMLNDNQDLNKKQILELLSNMLSEKEPGEVDKDTLEDYLRTQKSDSSKDYTEISEKLLDEIKDGDLAYYRRYIHKIEEEEIEFVPFYNDEYPQRLWSIPDAPLCLFVDGDLSALSGGVAVAGTRDAYDHRIDFVRKVAHKLVDMNKTVVSGLAHGVDAAAHEGALEAGGQTTAILPGDVQTIRPSRNESLSEKICDNGALVSEMTDKKGFHKGRYIERNRLTSGVSSAVVIGASGKTGGTIHQANFAKEQGKPRFIYQPEEEDGQSPDKLYDKGFIPFETVEELEELLNKEFEPHSETSGKSTTLDDFQ